MSKDRILIVRDRQTGLPIEIPASRIPKEIRPDNWFENAYWRNRPDHMNLEPLIRALYEEEPLTSTELKILAQYIVDYACHIACMGYLFGGGEEHARACAPYIIKLRAMAKKADTKDVIKAMIRAGMEYALDPF